MEIVLYYKILEEIMKTTPCIMLKTKDHRKFFTHKKNMPLLIEFSNTFGAELSVVKVEKDVILSIEQLAPAICDANYKSQPKYEVVESIIPESKKNRQEILNTAQKIRKHIRKKLLSKKGEISLKELKGKFPVTDACLSNHLKDVTEEMKKSGVNILKIGAGKYQCEK